MNGEQFIRRSRRWAKAHGLEFTLDSEGGKGSHQKVRIGERMTTVKHGEIKPPLLRAMLHQLGIGRDEF